MRSSGEERTLPRLARSREGGWYNPDLDESQLRYDYDPTPDGLVFVPSGDAARTRMAKATPGAIEAVEWTKRWGWKRVGCFVPAHAAEEIEQRLADTADRRARQRKKGREYRAKQEAAYRQEFAATLKRVFPRMPSRDVEMITRHTTEVGAGTVGRTRQLSIEDKVMLATIAHIRHTYTDYDLLVMRDKQGARAAVRDKIDEILAVWRWNEK